MEAASLLVPEKDFADLLYLGNLGQRVKRERNLGHLEFLREKGWVWDAVV